nr:MAG TPA: hypothetical protein [Caudoviricetes sp.]
MNWSLDWYLKSNPPIHDFWLSGLVKKTPIHSTNPQPKSYYTNYLATYLD